MLRKLSLVAVAAASLGAAALAPTSASAWGGGWHHGWHGGWGGPRIVIGGPAYYGGGYGYGGDGCYVRRLVPTPWGPRWRLVNRCY
ncbi:MAG: sulfur globule protein precursor [bacterium]|nr:sulfur globule protein precursor [bacterium]